MSDLGRRCDLVIDLSTLGPLFDTLHERLEAVDRAGYVPTRIHEIPAIDLARLDADVGPTAAARLAGGGAWVVSARAGGVPPSVCGSFGSDVTLDHARDAADVNDGAKLPKSDVRDGREPLEPASDSDNNRAFYGEPTENNQHRVDNEPALKPEATRIEYLGYAGYAAPVKAVHLERFRTLTDAGVAGPFALDGPLVGFRETFLVATLFSLYERGYRKAILPSVRVEALPHLTALLGAAILSQRELALPRRMRCVVCASGNGSNFQAVVDASDRLHVEITRLIVNKPGAYALERAERAGIPSSTIAWRRSNEPREEFNERILETVVDERPDCILLLGWMHLLPPEFVGRFPHILNIHPAYLPLNPWDDSVVLPDGSEQPAFRGAHAVDDALSHYANYIGASVHEVTNEVDRGFVLARAPLALVPNEDRASLDMRLHALEHHVLVEALERCIAERG